MLWIYLLLEPLCCLYKKRSGHLVSIFIGLQCGGIPGALVVPVSSADVFDTGVEATCAYLLAAIRLRGRRTRVAGGRILRAVY